MDAVKFIEERNRMCKSHKSCFGCPAYDRGFCRFDVSIAGDKTDSQIKIVEEWSAAHPIKTRQDVFLEQWPEARIDDNGVLGVCPATVPLSYRKDGCGCINIHKTCSNCRNEFWTGVVK